MAEARQGELLGGYGAARAVGRLEDGDVAARLGQRDRGREPVGARADHDRRAAHPAPQALGDLVQHAQLLDLALTPEGVLGFAAGHRVGARDVPGHLLPRPGRAHERAPVLLV